MACVAAADAVQQERAARFYAFSGIDPLTAVDAGYAVVIQDVRGRFASAGVFEAFVHERQDGEDTIAWAARQPWSNGNIVAYGTSYFGATALLAASAAPSALGGAVALLASADCYEGWTYYGGAFQLGLSLLWAAGDLARPELERRRAAGHDMSEVARHLEAMLRDPWAAYETLPLTDVPVLQELAPYYLDWLRHPVPDEYWRGISALERARDVCVPILHVAGWHDIFLKSGIDAFQQLRREAGTEAARDGQRLIVGPWAHAVPYEAVGENYHGPLASQGDSGLAGQILDFADAVIGGRSPDLSRVRVFVMGENRWRDYDDWPPPGARTLPFYLSSSGHANTAAGDGQLLPSIALAGTPHDRFLYDPCDPVPTTGGPTFLPGLHANLCCGPREQTQVETRHDVLVYTSEPLKQDLTVVGPLQVRLWAATSGQDADWTAKLVEVHPEGRALSIADGIVRASCREGTDKPLPVTPDRPYRFNIDLAGSAILLGRGHRIRLEVSSSNFPRFDRNLGGGVASEDSAEVRPKPTVQRVFHDETMPSCLLLPVVES